MERALREREFFADNLLVRHHFIIVMIRWTGLAPWEFEFPFPGSLTSTFLQVGDLTEAVSDMERALSSSERLVGKSFRSRSSFISSPLWTP